MKTAKISFTKLHENAKIPEYAHGADADAGLDIYALEDVTLHLGDIKIVKAGFAIEMPPGVECQVRSRSGLCAKFGIRVANQPGTIDPSYRGEIMGIMEKFYGPEPYTIKAGDRFAQLVFSEYVGVNVTQKKKLAASKRGGHGLGSTGR